MKTIKFNIDINTPKKNVWDTMLDAEAYKQWVEVSWPGSFYKGRWNQGEEISFISEDGSGTRAIIKELTPHKYIHAEHIALLNAGGDQDTTSDLAKDWIGTSEHYRFSEDNGKTLLEVEVVCSHHFEKMFQDGWPAALGKLKELAEDKVLQNVLD